MTPQPITLINTHGHVDHVCGNHLFTNVLIHRNDVPLLRPIYTRESRLRTLSRFQADALPGAVRPGRLGERYVELRHLLCGLPGL
jgi:glyoxylase-like metal-dependent hydrolase (beta-lactamase superfamily II)